MTTSNSVNLKEEIKNRILDAFEKDPHPYPYRHSLALRAIEGIMDDFNSWLIDQDARNPDGDELRIDP